MSEERIIAQADLRTIENNLSVIYDHINVLDAGVNTVSNNIKIVYNELEALTQEFRDYVNFQQRANRLNQAETRLVKIRQEIDKKFGHYDIIRRTTIGILQADDLGIVKKDTISNATEELMLSTPGYWLAPCLVALAAWINDQPDLAEQALREGIKRNDEKTSLFFALICRRAGRKLAALKWTQRYLANQDEEDLDRKTVILLDAFASGLLGTDTEGLMSKQMNEWLSKLKEKPGFIEEQTKQWSDAINLKREPLDTSSYEYLQKYSKTWPVLQDILEGANLHAIMLNYLIGIFEKKASTASLKEQLDEILTSLVSDFDDEELPFRKEEKLEQFIVDFGGDENRARQNMMLEQTAFDTHKDFTQLLTDAAMKADSSYASVSTQKFAFALSKDWVCNAYNDIIAQNRMKIPQDIEINVDSFNSKTANGENEAEILAEFNELIEYEKSNVLAFCILSGFDKFCLYGGAAIAIVGLPMMLATGFLGLVAIIAGIGLVIKHFSAKKQIEQNRQNIEKQFKEKQEKGEQIIRATLAEIVDFREEFATRDAESTKVLDFLDRISPDQYIRKLASSNRKIKM